MSAKTRKKTKAFSSASKRYKPQWPYYKLFITPQTLESRIREMQKLKFKISNHPRKPIALNLKTKTVLPTFKGKYTTFVDNDYLKYDILPLVYSEPELLKCQFRGQPSAINQYDGKAQELWNQFNQTLKKQPSINGKPDKQNQLSKYREFLYSQIKSCNNYRPTLAMQTYEFLGNAKSVLDFSAGWGDRLFAACVSQRKYIGLDPNINNRGVYDTIIKNHGSHDWQRVISTGAEYLPDATLKANMQDLGIKSFDIIATSPPYYDYEVYSHTAQSAMGFVDAPRWLIFWLGQVVYKYIPFLRPGGYLALYIQDTGKYSYVEPLVLFITSQPDKFDGLVCCGLIHSTRFPMLVFQKPMGISKTNNTTNAIKMLQLFKSTYPEHAQRAYLWRRIHQLMTDINTDSLTRTVIKYYINKTGQNAKCPDYQKYLDLVMVFNIKPTLISNPTKMDSLFMELWRESISEYKLIHGDKPETNIYPREFQEYYTTLFTS